MTNTEITEADGALRAPFRTAVNEFASEAGTIQSDQTAAAMGFEGGVVRGPTHLAHFPPLLIRAFGERWFEAGGLSISFIKPTLHADEVRNSLEVPSGADDEQVGAWVERADGMILARGTASIGAPKAMSQAGMQMRNTAGAGEVRILAGLEVGQRGEPQRVIATAEAVASAGWPQEEPVEWFTERSPWGGPILGPAHASMLAATSDGIPDFETPNVVSMLGAAEVRHLRGPLFVGREYQSQIEVAAIGASPRSEYVWYRSTITEAAGGDPIATVATMMRFLKDGSPLWAGDQA